jgi:hypothetical protein
MNPLHYWQYFVALESDLAKASRFVEISDDNMETYSVEFARLILCAGSEVDVLAKVLADQHGLIIMPSNIDGYREVITAKFQGFAFLSVRIPRYGRELTPWREWHEGKNPAWWRAYNDIKHERNVNFKQATLSNALNAVAGAFVLVCYICQKELCGNLAKPWPQLLSLDPQLNSRIRTDFRGGYVLPDFRAPRTSCP